MGRARRRGCTVTWGTVDGLIANAFTTIPAFVLMAGVIYLCRKGFFGPHQ